MAVIALLSFWAPKSAEAGRKANPAISKAARCYAAGDMVCVIEVLQNAELPASPDDVAERHRMLAIAAAKMDRHALARDAFAKWIVLDPRRHRLARSTTAPAVYNDWSAAWLQVHGKKLDLKPKKLPKPAPLPEPVTAGDLPRFPPPPRSERDAAADVTFEASAYSIPLKQGVGGTVAAVMNARSSLRVDLVGVVGTRIGKAASFGGVFVRPNLEVMQSGSITVRGALAVGALAWGDEDTDLLVAFEPGVRAVWKAGKSLAPFLHLGYALVARSEEPAIGPTVAIGFTILPAK